MEIKASVIVPAFNAEKTIAKCLEALSKQSFRGFEIIVVDDESNDGTCRVVEKFSKARLVKQRHGGPAVARNNGAKAAKGEIIVFTDSDCIAESNWLGEMVKPFENKGVAGVQGRYKCRQKEIVARLIQLEIEQSYERMQKMEFIDFIGSYSAAYRKNVFAQLKGFDTSFPIASGEDTDFSFRVHEKGHKMVFNPKAVVYHTHPTSFKKYFKVKFFRAFWRTKVYKRHKGKIVGDAYTSQMLKAQIGLFFLAVLAFIAGAIGIAPLFYSGALLVILLLSALPFAFWAGRKDLAVGAISPFMVLARTIVFSAGLVFGTIRQVFGQ